VHISELAAHHVENPREVVSQGQAVNVKIIEIDGERRRLSLSLKRIEDDDPVQPRADGGESVHLTPQLDLPEEPADEEPAVEAPADEEPTDEAPADEEPADEAPDAAPALEADAAAEEPAAEATPPTAEEPAEE
jgi:small subunit ribosomal protein S1